MPNDNQVNGNNEHINGNNEDNAKPAIWLIRKPINIPLEDLYRLRFSRKPKYQIQELTTDGTSYECRLERPVRPMYHATTVEADAGLPNKKPVMKTNDNVRGVVWINLAPTTIDNAGVADERS